jgi:RNase P/RNase MRP subunit p29
MQNNERTDNQTRITELAQAIEELSAELNRRLLIEENNEEAPPIDIGIPPVAVPVDIPQAALVPAILPHEFVVGDQVEITNNHRNLQGHRGYVIRTTHRQVIIRLLDSNNQVVRKNKTSVRLIEQ